MSNPVQLLRSPREEFHRIGIMNDYVRIPYANGSSFASQFLFREFTRRGHEVTVIGPRDPKARPEELPPRHVSFPALPLRNHPGVHLPLPARRQMKELVARRLDITVAQSCSELNNLGVWLRHKANVPFLSVNTAHLPSVYDVLLPEALHDNAAVHGVFLNRIIPWLQRHAAGVYNQTDGLIVLSQGLKQYWENQGVTVPIHVIPRAVDPQIFSQTGFLDPFSAAAEPGDRLVCVCRHTREKGLVRLLEIFARHIAPERPKATLTLVGDGPDHDTFKAVAQRLGVAHRVFFPGEFSVTEIPAWYQHADLFLYTSLSETYGQVVSEAMWCGLPLVALADGMGVSHQIAHNEDGILVNPGPDEDRSNRLFAKEVLALLRDPVRRTALGEAAREATLARSDPDQCVARFYGAFEEAKRHRAEASRHPSQINEWWLLTRWPLIHATVSAMGLVRRPAVVNRHGRRQPTWVQELVAGESPDALRRARAANSPIRLDQIRKASA